MQHQVSIPYEGVDSETPLNEQLSAKYMKSFAYYTVKDRLPVILTKVINELATRKGEIIREHGGVAEEDLKAAIGKISKLKNELVTNKSLVKLHSDGYDIEEWNNSLEALTNSNYDYPSWYYSPWLYIECYMYRRLWEIFENSTCLTELDPFTNQKEDAFEVLLNEVKAVGKTTLQILSQLDPYCTDLEDRFIEFLKLSLWSNRCDLSLSDGAHLSEQNCNIGNINALNSFLLWDDSKRAFKFLKEHSGVIDFVNDNSAFELFSDFCFCDLLCTSSLAYKIRFHVKKIPWYVSDTMKKDISWLLERLENEGLEKLSNRWRNYFHDGTWSVHDEKYWTLPHDYSAMKAKDPELYNLLSESNLIIFKGDLNYRKLLGDINWDHTEKLEVAIRDFKPTNILALRTVKADLICNLAPGVSESITKKEEMWMRTGKYAIIQFYQHAIL